MAAVTVDLASIAAAFGQALRDEGIPVTPERSARFATAVTLARPELERELYWLGRITLLSAHDQIPAYDRVFHRAFGGAVDLRVASAAEEEPGDRPGGPGDAPRADGRVGQEASASPPRATSQTPGEPTTSADPGERSVLAAFSDTELLAERPFAELAEEELALVAALVERLPLVPPRRLARRRIRHHAGQRLDIRATLRRAHRTSGDPVRLVRRARRERPRRVVLIADVSGSMEPYARVYLHLMRGAVRALGSEAFTFATRLTRITRPLRIEHPNAAYRAAMAAAPDWSGGTRIGAAIAEFTERWGRRGMARGAVIVIVSDGWETGDVAQLSTAMARLRLLAHRIVWVNPRKAASGYAPLVAGMAAALPHIDTFVSGHSVNAIEEVLSAIAERR